MDREYRIRVIETREYEVDYIVSAASPQEAESKAISGETVSETGARVLGIVDREILAPPTELP